MSKYRIYIDETGNADLGSSENPNHRFLSLTGVIFDLAYVDKCFHKEFDDFKKKHFPFHVDEPVIFHRKDMQDNGGFENDKISLFGKEIIGVLQQKYYKKSGKINGYGIKILP